MTLTEIYYRIQYLNDTIRKNAEDQDYFFNSVMEIAHLELLKEELEDSK